MRFNGSDDDEMIDALSDTSETRCRGLLEQVQVPGMVERHMPKYPARTSSDVPLLVADVKTEDILLFASLTSATCCVVLSTYETESK